MKLEYARLALRNLRKRKLRSWLTMIGIVISIAVLFLLVSVSIGLRGAVEEQFRLLGTDKFFIQPRGQLAGPGAGAVELTERDIEVIDKIVGVKDLSYVTVGDGTIEFNKKKRFFRVLGIPTDRSKVIQEVESYVPNEGRFLEKGDLGKVVIGSQYADDSLFGKSVRLRDRIEVNGFEFRVVGMMKTLGNPDDDRLIYMSMEDFEKIFPDAAGRIDQIIVQTAPNEDVNAVAERVEKKLRNSRGLSKDNQDFSVSTPEELLDSFGSVLNIITGFLLAVAAVSLIVGGIGITNTMYTSVLERTREIGVMKAIGARNSDILSIFLIESGLLGLAGGVIGVILGYAIAKGIELIAVYQLGTNLLEAAAPWWLFAGALAFSTVVGAVSGTLPARRASRLNPVSALRYE